jgi:hypothetical protein
MLARERGSFAPIMAPALAAHSINRCRLVVDAAVRSLRSLQRSLSPASRSGIWGARFQREQRSANGRRPRRADLLIRRCNGLNLRSMRWVIRMGGVARRRRHKEISRALLQCRHQPHHVVHVALALRPGTPLGEVHFVANLSVPVGDRLEVGNELLAGRHQRNFIVQPE